MDLALLEAVTQQEQASRRAYFDLLEIATRLERGYGHYFKDYDSSWMFFDQVSHPILDFNKNSYHILVEADPLNPGIIKQQAIPYSSQAFQCHHDIYDQNDRLVVRARDTSRLRAVPSDPVRMMDFITEFIANYCEKRIPVFAEKNDRFDKILASYLSDEFKETLEQIARQTPEEGAYFISEIYYLIDPLLAMVREFMGPNKWIIFTVRRQAMDLVIEAFVDYRIYDFHKRLQDEAEAKEAACES